MNNQQAVKAAMSLAAKYGVEEYVICSGARNLPLIEAVVSITKDDSLRFFDERAAGFYALGRCMAGCSAVAVLCTSGTAVAELLPSVIEAHYQGRRLVIISADRPESYRGSGAPQAIEQKDLFKNYVQRTWDLTGEESSAEVGQFSQGDQKIESSPVHINVCLAEPISGDGNLSPEELAAAPEIVEQKDQANLLKFLNENFSQAQNPLILAGSLEKEEGRALSQFAQRAGIPVAAEAISNIATLPEGLALSSDSRIYADNPPDWILRVGGVPSSRYWKELEDSEIPVLSLSRSGYSGLARQAESHLCCGEALISLLPQVEVSEKAQQPWTQRSQQFRAKVSKLIAEYPQSEPALIANLSRLVGDDEPIFLGNSLAIREWNLVAQDRGTHIAANRGANGIDGEISTYLGFSRGASKSWAVLGDLTTLYDSNAPLMLSQLPPSRRRVVVINNSGGQIFSHLPALRGADSTTAQYMENSQQVEFAKLAEFWGISHLPCREAADLSGESKVLGALLLEIIPDSAQTEAFWERLQEWEPS